MRKAFESDVLAIKKYLKLNISEFKIFVSSNGFKRYFDNSYETAEKKNLKINDYLNIFNGSGLSRGATIVVKSVVS